MTKKNIIAFAFVLVLLIGLYFGSVYLRNKNLTNNSSTDRSQELTPEVTTPETPSEKVYTYKYVMNYDSASGKPITDSSWDGKIIQIDPTTKKETVIISSVKASYPELKQSKNLGFSDLISLPNSNQIYLTKILYETDGFPQDIIRFDGPTKKFTKLKISNQFDSFAVSAISKTIPFIVTTDNPQNESDDRSLFLLDLGSDSSKLITKLSNTETFNSCYQQGCLGGVAGEITWLDDNYIEASIYSYSETEKDQWGNPVNKFIEKRKYKVR